MDNPENKSEVEKELSSSDYPDDSEFGLENMMMSASSLMSSPFGPPHALTRSVSLDESMLFPNSNMFKTPPTTGSGYQSHIGSPPDPAKTQYSFPNKLYNMLEVSDEAILGWLPNGKGFRVYDVETFTSQLLPKFFNRKQLSFIYIINIYIFSNCIIKILNLFEFDLLFIFRFQV